MWAFATATVILIVVGGLAYVSLGRAADAFALRGHTRDVLSALEKLQGAVVDAETSARGYALTGQDQYLTPYEAAVRLVPAHLTTLHLLTSDIADQQERAHALVPLIEQRLAHLSGVVNAQRQQGHEAAQKLVMTGQGIGLMNDIRDLVTEMRLSEERLFVLRESLAESEEKRVATMMIFGNALALFVVLTTAFFMVRNVAALHSSLLAVREQEWLQSRLASLGQLLREEQDVSVLGQRTLDH